MTEIYIMDFKIKIDLSNQSIISGTPKQEKNESKRKKDRSGKTERGERSEKPKRKPEDTDTPVNKVNNSHAMNGHQMTKKKKKYSRKSDKKVKENEVEKPKINTNSIISLSLPINDNLKGDQAQKLSMITKKKPRHWERRWVLVPNVFEFTKEIWLKKWVLVDGGDDIVDNNVRLIFFILLYRTICSNIIQITSNLIKTLHLRNTNARLRNVGKYSSTQALSESIY
jgi:hypothetical protein